MAQKVELRKRNSGSFAGDDNLMLPVTHVKAVLGLLDGDEKLNISLLPDSMLNTKRMAGTINADTNFGSLYGLIEDFNEEVEVMYPGSYFISNGKNEISPSTNHVIYYNDDGLNASTSVELEHGDHLFYVKMGDEYAWNDTENTLQVLANTGISDLSSPYNTISSSHIFATESEAAALNPSSSGVYGLVTGFKWVSASFSEYNAAGYKIDKISTIGGVHREADANYLVIPSYTLWDQGQESVVLKIDEPGITVSYWKLVKIDTTIQDPKVYQSTVYSNKHIWGVVNNTYDLATATSAGLMSAVDKAKLNSLENYTHPGYTSRNIDTSGVEVIDTFTSDSLGHVTSISKRTLPSATSESAGVMSAADKDKLDGLVNYEHPSYTARNIDTSGVEVVTGFKSNSTGHVTSISKRTLPNASTSAVGVVGLATSTQGRTGTDASKALTPAAGLAMLNYNQDVSYFASLSAANTATLPDGATAIIVTGDITI